MKKMIIKLGSTAAGWVRGKLNDQHEVRAAPTFAPPSVLQGVVPAGDKLAMDSDLSHVYAYANQHIGGYTAFLGYPTLAQLSQISEFRQLSEKPAAAMVRKWIVIKSTGDANKTERINDIEAELKRLKVRELFHEAAINDGLFGRSQLFVDLGAVEGPTLAIPLAMDAAVLKGKLRKFKLVEAMFTYPNGYNATNPLADDYYQPSTWFVMGQRVHASRLLTFVSRPVPDILKPAYNFGGLSMSQLAKTYVDNWLSTKRSVNKMISNYSLRGIKTNMSDTLSGGSGEDIMQRATLFSAMADNQGLLMLDNSPDAAEDFFGYSAPLTTLDALQAQAQEHMAAPSSMPLSILLGITPTGLNASTDGEIRTYYDHILDLQTRLFGPQLETVLKIIQLSKFGDYDPEIYAEFVPLWQQSEGELATNRKVDAETAAILIESGIVTTDEVRDKLANDDTSGYNGLTGAAPEPEGEEDGGNDPEADKAE